MAEEDIKKNDLWYKDAVIYELHIKAFKDSDGDGIGDINGLLEKLDYLQDLGITAIWLLPFYPSPLQDDGYDIADYYNINPSYGDIKQFRRLLTEAHKRGLKVITELVINHTSDQHPWFQRARNSPRGSSHRDYYVWSDDPNKYKDVRIIFQDFEMSNWTWDPVAQQYYWHRFFHHQPDLNYDNPAVQREVFKMIDYWCKLGVDGFRLDAVPYLFEREGTNCENLPETHVFLKKLRKYIDDHYPNTLFLAEANMWPEDSVSYFGNGDECHMNYHFPVMPRMFMALQMEDRYPITDIFDQTPPIPQNCQWAMFLRNHDELTLEMVTDEERDYMYKVYVKDPKARINLGIRHRLAPLMGNNRKKIELLNYLLFSFPGTPVIYYGDEIGMGDNVHLGDRDGVRTPMQWTGDRNAGFSSTNPQKLYLPLIIDPLYHYESVNVEIQDRNASSLLWWMKRIINTRKEYKALSWGSMDFIHTENPKVLVFVRSYEEQTVLVVANLSRFSQPVELELGKFSGYVPVEVFSKNRFPVIHEDVPYFVTLSPFDCQWFSLEKVHPNVDMKNELPSIIVHDWKEMMEDETLEELEDSILPEYLQKMRWFGGKNRGIQTIRIADRAPIKLKSAEALLLIVEVIYRSGLPENYQIPVCFGAADSAQKLRSSCPQSILANMTVGGANGVLYDAFFSHEFQHALLVKMANNQKVHIDHSEIRFSGNKHLKKYLTEHENIKSKILAADQSNTSITYNKSFFLKLYRKVDRAINPDIEITKYLTDKGFTHIPSYIGSIEWKNRDGTMVIGMMQKLVDNHGDAWTYMLDHLKVYNEKVLSSHKELRLNFPGNTPPLTYNEIPEGVKEIIDAAVAERARQLGVRTGEMHLVLASEPDLEAFKPEAFSLHYQRSLFSSFQTLVRRAVQTLSRTVKKLPDDIRQQAQDVLDMRDDILAELRKIYGRPIEVVKTRIHGDYHLGQALYTGKDFVILDFEGEPAKPYSERRLRRSPLRDVAGMVRSFHYAAYGSLFLNNQIRKEDIEILTPFAELWFHYMSGFFVRAYLDTVKGSSFIPKSEDDLKILMDAYLLEKAIYELNYELNNRPDWVIIPIRGIKSIMDKEANTLRPVKTAEYA